MADRHPLHVDDDGFVRAPAPLVYRRLTDVRAWPTWWPGVAVVERSAPEGGEVVAWTLRAGSRARPIAVTADLHGWRHDEGFALGLDGDLVGRAEFWLEAGWGGTVVHHVVVATTTLARPAATLRDYRRVLRRGLWALKDDLELEVRTGRPA